MRSSLDAGEHAIEAPTLGPRRGKPRVDSEALIEQIAGPSPRRGFHPELHPTHVQIESLGTRGAEPRTAPNIISGQRQRLDDALRQLVVQLEDRVHVDLQRMGPEHVPGRRAHQLRADPQPVVRSQDRACQHDIYREFSRRGSEVGDSVAYLAVLRLDRTTSDSSPDSALAITSARLKLNARSRDRF